MRVIVVGASGRVGRGIVAGLADEKFIDKVVSLEEGGIPPPKGRLDKWAVERRSVDLVENLADHFRFADAVVYAGWPVSIGNDPLSTRHLAVIENVCASVASAGVRLLVYGSSAGAYSPAPAGRPVEESWPTLGLASSLSSLQIAEGEHLVDQFENTHQALRVVRIRPSLIVCPPMMAVRRGSLLGRTMLAAFFQTGFVPDLGSHALQVVHVSDLARAFGLAVTGSVLEASTSQQLQSPQTSWLSSSTCARYPSRWAPHSSSSRSHGRSDFIQWIRRQSIWHLRVHSWTRHEHTASWDGRLTTRLSRC